MVEPWEEHKDVWKTKAAFFAWLRGAFRRALWEKYPGKIKFKNSQCKPPPENLITRAKSGAECALTGVWTGKSALEVDHIKGHISLQDWGDVLPFVKHLCDTSENYQLVSKEAHKIKSYAERMGITFEEAKKRKDVIAFQKLSTEEQMEQLRNINIEPAKSKKARVEQYENYVKEFS